MAETVLVFKCQNKVCKHVVEKTYGELVTNPQQGGKNLDAEKCPECEGPTTHEHSYARSER